MRWLQWSTVNLAKGLGGVEVHARSLARELQQLGIQSYFSMNPAELDNSQWDVIHTHGSASGPRGASRAIRVHTLHGTTLGRMAACGEWTWPGGYSAAGREIRGVMDADVVMSVHPRLSLLKLARTLGKASAVCWNGWDPADLPGVPQTLKGELRSRLQKLKEFWIFVGRGEDRMKGADRLKRTIQLVSDLKWVAAPGLGFEDLPEVLKTGVLSSAQVRELMSMAAGLVLPSRYEGHSLVLLEALAQGLPVVATRVGGVPVLPQGLEGLITADSGNPLALADAIRAAQAVDSKMSRKQRSEINRILLPTWRKVAEIYLATVEEFGQRSGRMIKTRTNHG